MLDITGDIYGRLTVVRSGHRDPNGILLWECLCSCGNIIYAKSGSLRKGYKKSCGCLLNETRKVNAHNMGKKNKIQSNETRFFKYVDKTDNCWLWNGDITVGGYGRFWYEGNSVRAHRVSYLLFIGTIPDNLSVLHKCDNPKCVNPEHLFLGTPTQNMEDRDSKNRQAKGENVGVAKLTYRKVKQIRTLLDMGSKSSEIAIRFSIAVSTVNRIKKRVSWKHVL